MAIADMLTMAVEAVWTPLGVTGLLTVAALAWTMLAGRWMSHDRAWTLWAAESDLTYIGLECRDLPSGSEPVRAPSRSARLDRVRGASAGPDRGHRRRVTPSP